MTTVWNKPIIWNRTTACLTCAAVAPFAICAVTGLFFGHSSCPMMIFYWIMTLAGFLAVRQIKTLGRRYALTISREFVIYKEPFRAKLIKIGELLSIHACTGKNLVLKTRHTTLVVPCSIFRNSDDLVTIKSRLERFAPPTCRIDFPVLAQARN